MLYLVVFIKENTVTGEKYAIYQAVSSDIEISLQVMGEWIYFEMGDNNLCRISVDGSRGQKYAPSLGNDVIIDWDVYNGNVYIIVRENLSVSTYNYYFAITDWDTQTYQKIFDIGDMDIDVDSSIPEGYTFAERTVSGSHSFKYRGAPYFLGVDEGYAYFVYTALESNAESSSFTAYRINLDDLGDTIQIDWMNDMELPYGSIYVANNCLYAFSFDLIGNFNFRNSSEDSYYDIINFNDNTITTYWIPELGGELNLRGINVSSLGILYNHFVPLYLVDNNNNVVKVSEDSASGICTAHNQVYYKSHDLYCRINLDGTGWESIDLNTFNWIDSTIVIE